MMSYGEEAVVASATALPHTRSEEVIENPNYVISINSCLILSAAAMAAVLARAFRSCTRVSARNWRPHGRVGREGVTWVDMHID